MPERTHPNRRHFLGFLSSIAALLWSRSAGRVSQVLGAEARRLDLGKTFVGIQITPASFLDEGVEALLDTLIEKAKVNTLCIASYAFDLAGAGRPAPGVPVPDHGKPQHDTNFQGGNFAKVHPQFYEGTLIKDFRAPDYGNWDVLETVLPLARVRKLRTYCFIVENPHGALARNIPNFPKVLEEDVYGRRGNVPCFNNPDYRNFLFSLVEDYTKSYPIDGIMIASERLGPLDDLLGGWTQSLAGYQDSTAGYVACFCPHCQAIARERGLSVDRACAGFLHLLKLRARADKGERPSDGFWVSYWRAIQKYPEVLAWNQLWHDSQQRVYGEIYGMAKSIRSELPVGWHIPQFFTLNPFYRAAVDYTTMSPYADFLKIACYHNVAGPRVAWGLSKLNKYFFGDLQPDQLLEFLYQIWGLREGALPDIPKGFSSRYVEAEVGRAVAATAGTGTAIYAGIDVDIPSKPANTTPDRVRAAVRSAFAAGASGIVISRKYSEMNLRNLAAVGDALEELSGVT